MKKNIAKVFAVVFSLMAVVFVGCTDEQIVQFHQVLRPSEVLCFRTSLENGVAVGTSRSTTGHLLIEEEEWTLDGSGSRASMKTSLDGKAQVLGFVKNGDELSYTSPDVNSILTFRGDELTNTTDPVFWNDIEKKEGDNLHVFAYAPQTIEGAGFETNNPTRFSYTVPGIEKNQSDKQMDIIVGTACVPKDDYRKEIPLTFKHIFTAVRFKLGFECTVKSIKMEGIKNRGTYTIGNGWGDFTNASASYEFAYGDGKNFGKDAIVGDTLMLLPQTLENAKVTMSYIDKNSEPKSFTATLDGRTWEEGKFITYTLRESAQGIIYLDLAAGDVTISKNLYSGAFYKEGAEGKVEKVTRTNESYQWDGKDLNGDGDYEDEGEVVPDGIPDVAFYVYQSTESTRKNNKGIIDKSGKFISPEYTPVKRNNQQLWRDYVIDNQDVYAVIDNWVTDVAAAGRIGTKNKIQVNAAKDVSYELVIDDVYSTYQNQNGSQSREDGGISFAPIDLENCKLTITTIGDNRLGNIHYATGKTDKGSKIIFEGEGSLTVADVDLSITGKAAGLPTGYPDGYFGNYYCSVIGGNDSGGSHECCRGIVINSGVLFAGSTVEENCSAIGGGGNGIGEVTINGGIVTAVASTTGTAIGGGIGYSAVGGEGIVTIEGGTVYAYNLNNKRGIPSSAIGGAGSSASNGTIGTVKIKGGYVYAYSALGTAIGGGSSRTQVGGDAVITIESGMVIAKSGSGAGIGGGSACTGGGNVDNDGGNAIVTINGNPVIRTGSIGGGLTGSTHSKATIGSATINISGNPDIQAQFVMAKGAGTKPKFTMSGGVIRNTDATKTFDKNVIETKVFRYTKNNGGAVYLEDGSFEMTGGTIENCTAVNGGAVYINGTDNPTFTMKGGTIKNCISNGSGGAVYLQGGTVTLNTEEDDTFISRNLANDGNGGGIYVEKGSFTMDGNVVFEGNSATNKSDKTDNKGNPLYGKGGALYVTSSTEKVDVNILSGYIRANASDRLGGAICVDMKEGAEASIVVGMEAGGGKGTPSITGNHTLSEGGGLYAKGENADITIYHGTINGNSTTAYVHNENVANEGGMVTLVGNEESVDVTHNVVYFHANGENATFNSEANVSEAIQRIVTSTNSRLVQPAYIARPGYTFVGWHTRADGDDSKGKSYKDGDVMNISANLHLYAQWQKDQ